MGAGALPLGKSAQGRPSQRSGIPQFERGQIQTGPGRPGQFPLVERIRLEYGTFLSKRRLYLVFPAFIDHWTLLCEKECRRFMGQNIKRPGFYRLAERFLLFLFGRTQRGGGFKRLPNPRRPQPNLCRRYFSPGGKQNYRWKAKWKLVLYQVSSQSRWLDRPTRLGIPLNSYERDIRANIDNNRELPSKLRFSLLQYFWQANPLIGRGSDTIPRFLQQLDIFKNFTSLELRTLAQTFHQRSFSDREVIFSENDVGVGFYLIYAGGVEIKAKSLGEGTLFGLKKGRILWRTGPFAGKKRAQCERREQRRLCFVGPFPPRFRRPHRQRPKHGRQITAIPGLSPGRPSDLPFRKYWGN